MMMAALAWLLLGAQAEPPAVPDNPGSLLGDRPRGASPYSGTQPSKEYHVHDHIRVVVRERASGQSAANLRSDRRSRWEADVAEFIRLRSTGHVLPELGAAALADDPGISIDARYRNDNLARTAREFTLEFTIMAEVVDRRPNGVLVIQAISSRTINEETETIRLTGEVSPHHILNDTVLSDHIANKQIHYEGSGPISDNARPGIVGWILQKLWPF